MLESETPHVSMWSTELKKPAGSDLEHCGCLGNILEKFGINKALCLNKSSQKLANYYKICPKDIQITFYEYNFVIRYKN